MWSYMNELRVFTQCHEGTVLVHNHKLTGKYIMILILEKNNRWVPDKETKGFVAKGGRRPASLESFNPVDIPNKPKTIGKCTDELLL